jgi:hypothetical protein
MRSCRSPTVRPSVCRTVKHYNVRAYNIRLKRFSIFRPVKSLDFIGTLGRLLKLYSFIYIYSQNAFAAHLDSPPHVYNRKCFITSFAFGFAAAHCLTVCRVAFQTKRVFLTRFASTTGVFFAYVYGIHSVRFAAATMKGAEETECMCKHTHTHTHSFITVNVI